MENPSTWGEAERIVQQVLDDFFANQKKRVTDPTKIMIGRSLPRHVTDALREAGLLKEEEVQARSCLDVPEFHCRNGEHCNCPACHDAGRFSKFRDLSHQEGS